MILGGFGESGIKIDAHIRYWNGSPFRTNSLFLTHIRQSLAVNLYAHHVLIIRLSIVLCAWLYLWWYHSTLQLPPTLRFSRVCVRVKCFWPFFRIRNWEKDPHFIISTSIILKPFSPHHIAILKKGKNQYNHLWEMWLLKSVKFILNHSVYEYILHIPNHLQCVNNYLKYCLANTLLYVRPWISRFCLQKLILTCEFQMHRK